MFHFSKVSKLLDSTPSPMEKACDSQYFGRALGINHETIVIQSVDLKDASQHLRRHKITLKTKQWLAQGWMDGT